MPERPDALCMSLLRFSGKSIRHNFSYAILFEKLYMLAKADKKIVPAMGFFYMAI